MISVVQLGRISYAEGLRLQQRLVGLRKAGQIGDVLLLLEHTPVITLGRNAKAANVLASPEQLAARGVEVFECDRGGDVTFHGPGQLVGYPIFDLRGFSRGQHSAVSTQQSAVNYPNEIAESSPSSRKRLGAVDYVRGLEEALIRTCGDFGIPTKRVTGLTGVWTEGENGEGSRGPSASQNIHAWREDSAPLRMTDGERTGSSTPGAKTSSADAKIAAIGVHISRSVTSHGFALNVNTDLSFFDLIVPCGIQAKPVTSMQKELGREVDLIAVAESTARNFGVVFGRQILWVETLDALLGNTVGLPVKAPAELRRLHGDEEPFLA